MQAHCQQCTREFTPRTALLNKGGGRFCSRACAALSKRIAVKCAHCTKEFYRSGPSNRFCSLSCAASGKEFQRKPNTVEKTRAARMKSPKLGHKIAMICDGCGKTFEEYESRRPKAQKFCTRKCSLDWQKGIQSVAFDIK
jgi:hypothetical protein